MTSITGMKPNRFVKCAVLWLCAHMLLAPAVRPAGITADAGLTPAEDRWIFRSQIRYMLWETDPTGMQREMSSVAVSTVLAYGLRSDLTLMIRQMLMHREMSMGGSESKETGAGDLLILAKYKAYRVNTPDHTLGIAPTLGLEFGTGHDSFSSGTTDISAGLYASWRGGPWGSDFNASYTWNGVTGRSGQGMIPGDQLSLDGALAHQFSIGQDAAAALAPVLEASYRRILPSSANGTDMPDTGESVIYVSPGIKFTMSALILEALAQIPVWQHHEGRQLERGITLIAGARLMF